MAYEINDIDNVRINPKISKEQFRVEWAPINGKKYRKQWCNASMLDAPIFISEPKLSPIMKGCFQNQQEYLSQTTNIY